MGPRRPSWLAGEHLPVVCGALLRLVLFPFAEDLWADAPVRGDLAAAWARSPGLWWSFERACQFGPLPIHLEGLVIRAGLPPGWGARFVPLLFGIAGIWVAGRLGRALAEAGAGAGAGAFAAWAVALSPLHLQASTTCASEAIYVAFALGLAVAAVEGRPGLLALCAFGATTTRYDSWLALPPLGLWLLLRELAGTDRKAAWPRRPAALGLALLRVAPLALGPASILLANGLASGHPLAPLAHVSRDHVALARPFAEQLGPLGWRLVQPLFWLGAPLAALTPGFGLAALAALRQIRSPIQRLRGAAGEPLSIVLAPLSIVLAPLSVVLAPLSIALAPPAVYLARGLLLADFLPMLRLALPPALLLAAVSRAAVSRAGRTAAGAAAAGRPWPGLPACIAWAVTADLLLAGLSLAPGPAQRLARYASPVSRLPDDLRRGAAWLALRPGETALDRGPAWEDIAMAHAAGVDRFALYAPKVPPRRVVALSGGALERALRRGEGAFGQRCEQIDRQGSVSLWACSEPRRRE